MSGEESQGTVVPAQVVSLLEERAKVQGWIEKLVDFREDASPEVYARVREDYAGRLAELNRRLADHRADLESSLETHRRRVAELQERRDERAAELEEAELRYSVGEYGEEEWAQRRQSGQSELERVDAELEEERTALGELERTLASLPGSDEEARGPAAPGVDVTEAAERVEEPGAEPRPVAPDAVAESPESEDAVARRDREDADLLESSPLAEVAGPPRRRADSDVRPRAEKEAEPGDEESMEDADFLDELEFLESLSLDEAERFDAVSAMLEEDAEEGEEEGEGEGKRP